MLGFFVFQTERIGNKLEKKDERIIYQSSSRDANDRIGVWGSLAVCESVDLCWYDDKRRRGFLPLVEDDEDIDNNCSRSERRFSIARK